MLAMYEAHALIGSQTRRLKAMPADDGTHGARARTDVRMGFAAAQVWPDQRHQPLELPLAQPQLEKVCQRVDEIVEVRARDPVARRE